MGKYSKILELCNNHAMGTPKDVVKWRSDIEKWVNERKQYHNFVSICVNHGMRNPVDDKSLYLGILDILV